MYFFRIRVPTALKEQNIFSIEPESVIIHDFSKIRFKYINGFYEKGRKVFTIFGLYVSILYEISCRIEWYHCRSPVRLILPGISHKRYIQ